MKFILARVVIVTVILLVIDLYSFQAVKTVSSGLSGTSRRWIYGIFWGITILMLLTLLSAMVTDFYHWPRWIRNYIFAVLMIIYICKVLILPFMLIDDLSRGIEWIVLKLRGPDPGSIAPDAPRVSRHQFITQAAIIVAGIPFVAFLYGMVYGGYDYKVRRYTLRFRNLPKAFNGLRILQISDIHTGSFSETHHLEKAIRMANAEKADIAFFTGDLVNNLTDEVYPFVEALSQLRAPMGVYSSLGNHDYGDYAQWPSESDKQMNLEALFKAHSDIGWKLLRNESIILERNEEKIAIAGCENWSKSKHFPRYGDLNKTLRGIAEAPFTILMSHDPSHWEGQVLDHPHHVDLMLAGHTHGMQFGVDTKWLKWSPVQYFYKQWAGLYSKGDKYLYVNRGLGFLGYPGRAGIRPEITVIDLYSV